MMLLSSGVSRKAIIGAIAAIITFACGVPDSRSEEGKEQTIDLGTFTVNVPSGRDWSVEVNKESGEAQAKKQKKSFFGGGLPVTVIHVSKAVLREEMWTKKEEEIANGYRDSEHGNMIAQGVLSGAYLLYDVKKDTMTLNGKRLYTFSYTQKGGEWLGNDKISDAILYLYFPPDFEKTHTFYRFLINQINKLDNSVHPDLEPIKSVINSFHIK